MANNQNIPVRTEIVGGDKNFSAWTVYIDARGNRTHVDIPIGSRSGSNVYRIDEKLNRIIDALKKADIGRDSVWPGRSADIIRRIDTNITAQADHSNPKLNTKTIEGSNAALAQLHGNLLDRALYVPPWDRPSMIRGSTVGTSLSDMDHGGHKAGHAGPAGQRGHAHIGAMGLAATAIAGVMAFQQAKAAGLDLKGQFKAAAAAVLPTGVAFAQGRKAEAIAATVDRLDPTGGFVSNGVRGVMRSVGLDVEEGALSSASKNKNPQQVIRDKQLNDRIGREQAALFDANHPDQLGALKVTDPKTGKKLDTANVLKDPAQRHVVFDEIKRLEKSATTPEMREAVGHMREAAQQFVDLEKRRRPVLDRTDYAMGTGPGVTKQVVASPVIGSPAGGPG